MKPEGGEATVSVPPRTFRLGCALAVRLKVYPGRMPLLGLMSMLADVRPGVWM
jgi:hypothetical protein